MIDKTKPERLFLLGHPVSHSRSPLMHNAVYKRLGLPWVYEPVDCVNEENARAFLEKRDFLALNITTPYKSLAFCNATAQAASAKLAQGANVLVRKGGSLLAYNTDGQGFVAYLERCGFSFLGKRIAVCGTGPTALSILHACALAGADVVLLVGRDKDRARQTLKAYIERFQLMATATVDLPPAQAHHRSFRTAYERTLFKFGSYATSLKALSSADLVVDATPLGMKCGDPAPFDTGILRHGQVVFDTVYGQGTTELISAARAAGCTAYDGAGMLVAQAVSSLLIVCDLAGVEVALSDDELFDLMACAAGFSCL